MEANLLFSQELLQVRAKLIVGLSKFCLSPTEIRALIRIQFGRLATSGNEPSKSHEESITVNGCQDL